MSGLFYLPTLQLIVADVQLLQADQFKEPSRKLAYQKGSPDIARQKKARQDKTRQDTTRQGKANGSPELMRRKEQKSHRIESSVR